MYILCRFLPSKTVFSRVNWHARFLSRSRAGRERHFYWAWRAQSKYKLCRCDHWVFEFESFSLLMNRKQNKTWNKCPTVKIFYETKCAAGKNLNEKKCAAGKSSQTNALQARFFDWILMGSLSCWCSMWFVFLSLQFRILFVYLIRYPLAGL